MIEFVENEGHGAQLRIVGVGGAGGNAINTMINGGLSGVDFIVANTDAQALQVNLAPTKIQLGSESTKGLGAGANPETGRNATLETEDELRQHLAGADMVFVTAGMGGGTGTGGAPIVARLAKESGALTVGVVTKPFLFEGRRRMRQADEGIHELKENVDTLICIPNQRLLAVVSRSQPLIEAFHKADEVLFQAVQGISDLIMKPGLVNLDFADVRTIMAEMGMAIMGAATASGENRAEEAARRAIASPLLEDMSVSGARGVLINVTGGRSITLHEVTEAATLIQEEADEDANVIWGQVIDDNMEEELRITVIATGFDEQGREQPKTPTLSAVSGGRRNTKGPLGTFDPAVLEQPAYARRRTLGQSSVIPPAKDPDSEQSDELAEGMPVFLRKQAN